MPQKLVSLKKTAPKSPKKQTATFRDTRSGRTKTTSFGAKGMSDQTLHKDATRKSRYLKRHSKREHWGNPTSAGSLSRQILWNKPSFRASLADQKRRFRM